MRVFLAGGSGAIGQRLVPKLVAAGHDVTAMTREADRGAALSALGAESAICDVFDFEALTAAVATAAPEVVINQLTSLPQRLDLRDLDRQYAPNDRIRTEGTRNLVEAAQAAGVRRIVAQSVSFFYAMAGGMVKSESDSLNLGAPPPFDRSAAALAYLEDTVTGNQDFDGVILRYGIFYGPGTYFALDGATAEEVRRRRYPVVGKGTGVFSFIHVDDAADATVAALTGAPGIYNVTDDEPVPMSEWLPVYAEALGAKAPRRVPVWLAKIVVGKPTVGQALEMRGASNEKARRELGWAPAHPSWRTGFAETLS